MFIYKQESRLQCLSYIDAQVIRVRYLQKVFTPFISDTRSMPNTHIYQKKGPQVQQHIYLYCNNVTQ